MRVLEQGNPLQVAPEPLVALRSPPCPFVDFFFGRRGSAFTPQPHQPSPSGSASATLLKGGVIRQFLGARASRPHPCSLWGLLSISATLQAATTSAGIATAGSKESQGAVGSIQVREKAEAVPGLVRAGRPRSRVVVIETSSLLPLKGGAIINIGKRRQTPWWLFTHPFRVSSNPLEFLRGCSLFPSQPVANPSRLSSTP